MSESLSSCLRRAAAAGRETLIELVLPPVCRLCNLPVNASDDFCGGCEKSLSISEFIMRHACPACARPRPRPLAPSIEAPTRPREQPHPEQPEPDHCEPDHCEPDHCEPDHCEPEQPEPAGKGEDLRCPRCRDQVFWFDSVVAMWAYQDRVCEAVVAAKYPHQAALADALGRRLAKRVQGRFLAQLPDVVTFVPSHLTRQIARGGNGVSVIAASLARAIARPCRPLLRTTRALAKQAWLDDQQRVENVHGAFAAKKSYALSRTPRLPDQHILVVDDVLTTGATANEVARVLLDSGVRRVSLAVVARAIRSR